MMRKTADVCWWWRVREVNRDKGSSLLSITIGKNVKSIGNNAFKGCDKLKIIKIRSLSLKPSRVGARAFAGTNAEVKIKLPAGKKAAYKKWIYKKRLKKR